MRGARVYFFGSILASAVAGLYLLAGPGPVALAQVVNGNLWPNPRLTIITPCGGKVGTTFDVTFAGTELNDPKGFVFSHPGIKAEPIIPPPPKVDPKVKPDPKVPPPPPPPITSFKVTIGKDVPLGHHDVRFVNKWGVSNPRVFIVGELNEVAEKEPNNDVEQAHKVEIGTTITGNMASPVDVDYCMFPGKKGQRVVVSCLCASLDSRLHPELKLLDAAGKQLSYHRPSPGQDAVLDATLPDDGEYLVRLNHFTYTQGSAEFFYRLNISTGPWIDAVFPPSIEPGKAAQVTVYGRNLPGGKPDPAAVLDGQVLDKLTVNITAPNDAVGLNFRGPVPPQSAFLDGFEYRFAGPTGASNAILMTYAKAPVILENDDNDISDKAQTVPVPCEIAGRIDKPGDRDWYVFEAKKGDVFIIEAFSHRLGANTDLVLSVRQTVITKEIVKAKDDKEKPKEIEKKTLQEIVNLDDNAETINARNLSTSTRDPAPYRFVAPADGKYHVLVTSHLLPDPTHVYRLRISKETPDFRLVVTPADDHKPDSCFLGQGGVQHYNVYAQRLDGFTGDIDLSMDNLPAGVTCPPQILTRGKKEGLLVVIAVDNAALFVGGVKVKGAAVINGQKVEREARPATVTWSVPINQNIATVTRLDQQLMLAVVDKAPGKLVAAIDKINTSVGEKFTINYKLIRHSPEFKAAFQVQPVPADMPAGMTFGALNFAPGKDDQAAGLATAPTTPPGTYNLVLRGFAAISFDPKGKGVNTILPSTSVLVSVLPKQVATLTVDNPNPSLKAGAEAVILVKVARQFDYDDAFKVTLELPKGVDGVSAADITIPAGQSEAKLTLKVPAAAAVGPRPNINLKASAVVTGVAGSVTLLHETKINVTIVK